MAGLDLERLAAVAEDTKVADEAYAMWPRIKRYLLDSERWPAAEVAELQATLTEDFAAGDGVPREVPIPRGERLRLWRDWLKASYGFLFRPLPAMGRTG